MQAPINRFRHASYEVRVVATPRKYGDAEALTVLPLIQTTARLPPVVKILPDLDHFVTTSFGVTTIYFEGDMMSSNNGRVKLSEKGLLTPDNCVVALIDHQPQMLFGVSNFDRQTIINNTVALAKAARVFDVPVVLTTVETKSFSGNLWPQIRAVFPKQEPIERSSMNAWDDKNFVAAIERTGRKKIVLCGLWTEVCVAFPAVQAIHDGYEIFVAEDCCGDVNQLSHDNAMRRVFQAGAKPVTALSTMLEWQRDWAHKDTYDAVMDIVRTHLGAYGIGVEYAYTMIHGAPATTFPEYVIPSALAGAHK
jgi:nicotinamidase-related amidase